MSTNTLTISLKKNRFRESKLNIHLVNKLAPNIPVEAVNQVMQQLITDNNQVVLLAGPEKRRSKNTLLKKKLLLY